MPAKRSRPGLEAEAVFDKRVGLVKVLVTNKTGTSVLVEAVKLYYTRLIMIGIVVSILLMIVIVVGVIHHTEDVVGVVNTLLTMGVIVVGILGKKIGQKTIVKTVRALMGNDETYTITIPIRKKPTSIEIYTNRGVLKPRIKEIGLVRPKPLVARRQVPPRGGVKLG